MSGYRTSPATIFRYCQTAVLAVSFVLCGHFLPQTGTRETRLNLPVRPPLAKRGEANARWFCLFFVSLPPPHLFCRIEMMATNGRCGFVEIRPFLQLLSKAENPRCERRRPFAGNDTFFANTAVFPPCVYRVYIVNLRIICIQLYTR